MSTLVPYLRLPPAFEILSTGWRRCQRHFGQLALESHTSLEWQFDYTARRCSHQREHTLASNINWNRSPLRRKDFKRRTSKHRASVHPYLKQVITYLLISALTLLYYTTPSRSSLLVIFMDSLICKQILQSMIHVGSRCRQKLQVPDRVHRHCIGHHVP